MGRGLLRGLGSKGDAGPEASPGDAGPKGVLGESMFFTTRYCRGLGWSREAKTQWRPIWLLETVGSRFRIACEVEKVKLSRCGRTCYYENAAANNIKWPEFMPCAALYIIFSAARRVPATARPTEGKHV